MSATVSIVLITMNMVHLVHDKYRGRGKMK